MEETEEKTQWITRVEAAAFLGVSLRTLRRYMDSGRVEYRRDERTGRVHINADRLSVKVSARYL